MQESAPIAWSQLLKDAVEKPGVLSNAFHMFHNYSIGNMMLAFSQCLSRGLPLGPLATFKRWQSLGRFVQKGQKAIVLCMPITIKDRNDENKRFTRFTYRPRWFVMGQTEGADYKAAMPSMEWDALQAEIKLGISEVAFELPDGNTMGYAKHKTYAINPVNPSPAKTRFHEMAHIVLGHTEMLDCMGAQERISRPDMEVEAESVAMILCEVLGLDGAAECRGYIQHWMGNKVHPIDDKMAQRIFAAAEKILKAGQPVKVEAEMEAEPVEA